MCIEDGMDEFHAVLDGVCEVGGGSENEVKIFLKRALVLDRCAKNYLGEKAVEVRVDYLLG